MGIYSQSSLSMSAEITTGIVTPMNKSLRTRLLIIFAALSLAIVLTTVWLTRIAFERGFVNYLDQQNLEGLEAIAEVLSDYYAEQGSWQVLKSNSGLWRDLVEVRRGPPQRPFDPLRREQFDPSDFSEGFPAPEAIPRPTDFLAESGSGDLVLLGIQGDWIGGRRQEFDLGNWLAVPVEVEGEKVGSLYGSPVLEIGEGLDQSFVNSQLRSSVLVAILTLAFALPLALYIAARLLAPVKSLALGVQKLTQGDYATNIEIESRDELGQLARDLNTLASTLRSNKTAQQRWISDISHELRTPVAILEGEIHAILDGIRQPNDKEMQSLATEVSRLGRLINDLHQLSKSDAGDLSYRMEPIEMGMLLQQVTQTFEHRMAEANLKLSLDTGNGNTWVFGDESRLIQLFGNLLENSCRYTDGPGEISFNVSTDKSKVIVSLSDSAPGVLDQELPQLFDRLYRVEQSRNRTSGGSGLGLSICQNIAQAHNAVLAADHSDLGGLKMTCIFPKYDRKAGRN